MKTLYLDFETSPIVGWAWVGYEADLFHIMRDVQIISVAWNWEGEDKIYALGVHEMKGYKPGILNLDDKKFVESFLEIFDRADVIVAHNGRGFDFKLWRTRLLVHGFPPYHDIKEVDTKTWAKKFRFTNNKQDTISRQLGTPMKVETDKNLHYKCIELGDPKAWRHMIHYNKGDIKGLKANAHRMAPWIQNQPNLNIYNETRMNCTNLTCGSAHMKKSLRRKTASGGIRQQYQCQDCGHYATGPYSTMGTVLK